MGRTTAGSLDVKRIVADIESSFAIVNRFTEVKKKITASKTQLDGISEYVDDLRRDLLTVLQRIRDTVSETVPKQQAA